MDEGIGGTPNASMFLPGGMNWLCACPTATASNKTISKVDLLPSRAKINEAEALLWVLCSDRMRSFLTRWPEETNLPSSVDLKVRYICTRRETRPDLPA